MIEIIGWNQNRELPLVSFDRWPSSSSSLDFLKVSLVEAAVVNEVEGRNERDLRDL